MRTLIRFTLPLLLAAPACSSGPKYKIDDKMVVQIPVDQKQGMLAAQGEQNIATEELKKAKADLEAVERDLDIAENEKKSAKLGRSSAELNMKAADQSGDLNRKASAERDLHVAELGYKAGDAKVDWLERKRKWVKQQLEAAEAHQAVADSRYELEKARLVSSKGMKPSEDFNVMNFETENLEKQKRWSEARIDVDKRKADVDDLERKWTALNEQWTQAKAGH